MNVIVVHCWIFRVLWFFVKIDFLTLFCSMKSIEQNLSFRNGGGRRNKMAAVINVQCICIFHFVWERHAAKERPSLSMLPHPPLIKTERRKSPYQYSLLQKVVVFSIFFLCWTRGKPSTYMTSLTIYLSHAEWSTQWTIYNFADSLTETLL